MLNDQLKPIAEVSHETLSSDGTSNIITCNLPIGTKLYATPVAAVVMPPRKSDGNLPDYQWQKVQAYNAALDEVARLNRRAIPAGLLERIQVELDDYHSMDLIGTHGCDDELRALLGKDGSQ